MILRLCEEKISWPHWPTQPLTRAGVVHRAQGASGSHAAAPLPASAIQLSDWLPGEPADRGQTGTIGVGAQLREQASIIRLYLLIHPVGVFPLWPATHSNTHAGPSEPRMNEAIRARLLGVV